MADCGGYGKERLHVPVEAAFYPSPAPAGQAVLKVGQTVCAKFTGEAILRYLGAFMLCSNFRGFLQKKKYGIKDTV